MKSATMAAQLGGAVSYAPGKGKKFIFSLNPQTGSDAQLCYSRCMGNIFSPGVDRPVREAGH
jgi:hypothetical protein